MSVFRLAAFSDEAGQALDTQIQALHDNRIGLMEIRNVDGKSCVDLTDEECRAIRDRLWCEGLGFSSLGSPCGKYPIDQPFEPHLNVFRRALDICHILRVDRMRMFSFFMPAGDDVNNWKQAVIDRVGVMLDLSDEAGITLCHENEKNIFGEKDTHCVELLSAFGGRLKAVYDPGNFVQAHVGKEGFPGIRPYLSYMHIKDGLFADGAIVPSGKGESGMRDVLDQASQAYDDVILTLEPHLQVFDGLAKLQSEGLVHHYSYPDAATAFKAAADALKEVMASLNFVEKGDKGIWQR